MSIQNRRQFIRYGSGAIAATALLAGGWWQWGRQVQPEMTPTGLGAGADQVLASLNGAGAVGQWVINDYPQYNLPVAELVNTLRSRLQLPAAEPVDKELFSQQLHNRIKQDFAQVDLLEVQGWQLSKTEALAAAIRYQTIGVSSSAVTQQPVERQIVEIINWGPRTTSAGSMPNSFGEGFSALWFDADDAPRWAQIAINGHRLRTSYRENRVLVASFQGQLKLQDQIFSQPGEYQITLHDDMQNTWQTIATFVVTEAAPGQQPVAQETPQNPAFCKVKNWGPKRTTAGVARQKQKNGNMGIWIDIDCAPDDTRLMAGNRQFKTYASDGVITSGIPPELFQSPTEIPLSLVSESTGAQLEIGVLVIDPN